ncbi:hypothetical protein KRX53_03300 [Dermabacteraceae bacterium TAE3-ERU5]|nr:hypothetical protein [Dermabacteraceae bacterium TAE3-ERU5]
MSRPVAQLPRPLAKAGAFPVSLARAHGVGRYRLLRQDVMRLAKGMYCRTDPPPTELEVIRALLFARANTRDDLALYPVSHFSAARIWGMPLPTHSASYTRGQPVDMTYFSGAPSRRNTLVKWHKAVRYGAEPGITEPAIYRAETICLTSRWRTLLDLTPLLPPDYLVIIADHLVRQPRQNLEQRSKPYAALSDLERAARTCLSIRAKRKLLRALSLSRVGSDSPLETLLRLRLAEAGLPEPNLNVHITDDDGRPLHQPDMSWPRYRVALEYEGRHHGLPEQISRDISRAERCRQAGWLEVRIEKSMMYNRAEVAVAKVAQALRERGWEEQR